MLYIVLCRNCIAQYIAQLLNDIEFKSCFPHQDLET